MWYGAILSVLCPIHTPTCFLSSPMPCPDPAPKFPSETDGNPTPASCAAAVEPGSSSAGVPPPAALPEVFALPWPPPSRGASAAEKEPVPVVVVVVVVVAMVGLAVLVFSSSLLLSPLPVVVVVVVRVSPVVSDSHPLSQSGWCWSSTRRWISYRVIGSPFPIEFVFRAHVHRVHALIKFEREVWEGEIRVRLDGNDSCLFLILLSCSAVIFPAAVRGFSDGTVVAKFQECRAPPHHHKKSTTLARKPQTKSGPKHLSVSTDQHIQSQGTASTPSPYNTFTTELPLNALYASPKELQKTHYFFPCTSHRGPSNRIKPCGRYGANREKRPRRRQKSTLQLNRSNAHRSRTWGVPSPL